MKYGKRDLNKTTTKYEFILIRIYRSRWPTFKQRNYMHSQRRIKFYFDLHWPPSKQFTPVAIYEFKRSFQLSKDV
jgi:hypothetical protein